MLAFKVTDGLGLSVSTIGVPTGSNGRLDALSIAFRLGEGHTLKFTSTTFEFFTSARAQIIPISVSEVTRIDSVLLPNKRWEPKVVKFSILEELQGGDLPEVSRSALNVDFQNWRSYGLWLPLDRDDRSLTVRFPSILLNGKSVTIPDIRIEYGTYTHLRTLC